MKVIELIDVYKIYKIGGEEVYALNGVSMEVKRGEFIAIMGPSGSGKSTLLNMIGCLDKPTKGKVIINGVETSGLDDDTLTRLRRDTVGFVFQQYNLIPTLTAIENVELPMIFKGISKREREKKAFELLNLVGLEKEAKRKPNEMSGGQQQRVAIARALANNPEILLCDEPTGNLDTKSGEKIMQILSELNERGVTLIIVTHDPSIAEYANKTVRILDGSIVG
ncbi:ABC-type antimicrobial peptide transport system, ATPase component [Archaeoglobus sulfaticallidus PM70-1]|uniref:ABC-type antimicrobial peptide transport system, ATPase component n=1 Tax=Archaeoglobus sulfaticallidus PM70-1 TaxID=387631 RepID=N0BDU4_9EURY|nr:ABC transporter ATP-binding protein [Archaeoglobus sulfaticallidus]AGK60402.1 ABC-type antimicrobial peptide transport system, ATPase component [Archaeoglobus sulfaticallidus PM70-1]